MSIINKAHMIEFPNIEDERGNLVIIEGSKDIPFEIKRAFYIWGSDSKTIRGKHANRESEFILINVAGKSKIRVDDGLGNIQTFSLHKPNQGLYIPKMVWKEMYDFSEDSILLVLSNTHYESTEYIKDLDEFINEVNRERNILI